jgi:predicted GNAT family acetyltransferase
MSASPSVTDNQERSRLELQVDGELAGWLDYRPAGDSIIIAHTEVMDGHEGEGLGGVLVRSALEAARAGGKTVIATCPFASSYIARHPELDEFLAPWARRRPESG